MLRICLTLFVVFSIAHGHTVSAQNLSDQIRISLEKLSQEKPHTLNGTPIRNLEGVYQFFALRNFDPIWSREGVLTERAYEMRFEIRQSKFDGLDPEDYQLDVLNAGLEEADRKKKAGEKR